MDGRCRLSPHRGHYWVEETPESDDWACRWCGKIRHFNRERAEKMRLSETTTAASEHASQQWLFEHVQRRSSGLVRDRSLSSDASSYLYSSG